MNTIVATTEGAPLRGDAPDADFELVRETLRAADYTESSVCRRTGFDTIQAFLPRRDPATAPEVVDALDLIIRLFLDCQAVPVSRVQTFLPARSIEAMIALGVLRLTTGDPPAYEGTVLLPPIRGLYVASDRDDVPVGVDPDVHRRPDHVFSAITSLTGTFLTQLPTIPCEALLELCAGSGIAALDGARRAGHAWSLDITERSTYFASFNARLNGIDNFTAQRGDLFEPVQGLTFDRIVAHPPYVPASETRLIYRDGGADGEEIFRRILGDLPLYLRPGGTFHCTCVATDREGAPLEQRVRETIGAAAADFDVLVVVHHALVPAEYYSRLAAAGRMTFNTAGDRIHQFRRLAVESIVYCSISLQRRSSDRPVVTVRREIGEGSGGQEAGWLLRATSASAARDVLPEVLDARLRLSPHLRLHVIHRSDPDGWKVDSARIEVSSPFKRTVEVSTNGSLLLTLFDGSRTVREVFSQIRSGGGAPAEVPERDFAEFAWELLVEGVLLDDDQWGVATPDGVTSSALDRQ